MICVHIYDILMDSSFPLKEHAEKYDIVTENDKWNNGKKFYVEIVEGNRKKNNDKNIMKRKEEKKDSTSSNKVQRKDKNIRKEVMKENNNDMAG